MLLEKTSANNKREVFILKYCKKGLQKLILKPFFKIAPKGDILKSIFMVDELTSATPT